MYIYLKERKEEIQRRTSTKRMWHFPFLPIPIFLFSFLLIPPTNRNFIMAYSGGLINSTCKKCAEKSTIFNYNFCVSSLQPIPVSHAANLEGLAIVSMELALENATSTLTTIERMLSSKAFDPFVEECLTDCLELYADAISMLVTSIGSFLSSHFDTANLLMRAVLGATAACEEGFTDKKGEPTPLMKENYNLFGISSIALCIINLVSLELAPPLSSCKL